MSFNTAAQYGCHQPIPSSNQTRCEPLPPRRPRASTMTQDANSRWHPDAQRMPGLRATGNNSPPLIFNREYSVIRDDVNVQYDRVMAAIEQESIDMKSAMHEYIKRERERKPLPPIPKSPTTKDPQCHPRRFSFDHATGHDHSGEHQHPVYNLPPNAPFPQIIMPTRRRAASVKAVRRLRFHKPKAPQLEESNPSTSKKI